MNKEENLSVKKATIESDKYLVKVIARHYDMLKYIHIDSYDKKMKRDYNFIIPDKTEGRNKKDSPHKYIATAVEAMIGAIYKEEKDLQLIIELIDSWLKMTED